MSTQQCCVSTTVGCKSGRFYSLNPSSHVHQVVYHSIKIIEKLKPELAIVCSTRLVFHGYVVQLKTTWLQIFVAKFSGASNYEVMHFHCKECSLKYRVVLS